MNSCEINKLEGRQKGINLFENLSFSEIYFISQRLAAPILHRGCKNRCLHCYAQAMPPLKEDLDHINKISFNDFNLLIDGYTRLRKSIGFDICYNPHAFHAMFYDSDSIDTFLKDNNGIIYDFCYLSETLSKALGVKHVFDTCGWYINDKISQEYAEKYAKYYSVPDNMKKIEIFNLSINTFHPLYAKYNEYFSINRDKALKYKKIYIKRTANMLYTFSTLLEHKNFRLLLRAVRNDNEKAAGYIEKDLEKLLNEIFLELKKLYSQNQIEDANKKIELYRKKTVRIDTDLAGAGRAKYFFSPEDRELIFAQEQTDMLNKNPAAALYDKNFDTIIDINGKVYLTNYINTFETEIQLNYENKNKKTAPIHPNLNKYIITKQDIKDYVNNL